MRDPSRDGEGEEPVVSGPEDRLLDHMLERCLGDEAEDSALVERVVAALQRGERGSLEPEELEALRLVAENTGEADQEEASPAPAGDAVDPRRRGVLRPWPHAPLDAEAPPLQRNGATVNGHAREGASVLPPTGGSEGVELLGGGSQDRPPSLRRVAAAVVLLSGAVGGWYWISGNAGVEPGAQTDDPAGPPLVKGTDLPGPEPPGPTIPDVPSESPLDRRFDELNARLFAPAKNPFVWGTWGVPGYGSRRPAMQELSQLMDDEPRLWERFEKDLDQMLSEPEEPMKMALMDPLMEERGFRRRVVPLALDFLIQDDSPRSLTIALELWDGYPEHFDHVHQIAFAERGAEDFLRECSDLVSIYDPSYDEPPYYPAAYLAFQNETQGREILTNILTKEDPELLDARLLSALALDHLEDSNAWSWMRERCRRAIEDYLDSDMRAAVQAVLLLEYYSGVRSRGETSVARISIELIDHLMERSDEVGTEEDVRTLLATLF